MLGGRPVQFQPGFGGGADEATVDRGVVFCGGDIDVGVGGVVGGVEFGGGGCGGGGAVADDFVVYEVDDTGVVAGFQPDVFAW